MFDADINHDFPCAVRALFPNRDVLSKRLRLRIVARFLQFPGSGRVPKLAGAGDGGESWPPDQERFFRLFLPIFCSINGPGREHDAVIRENMNGRGAKSLFQRELAVISFRLDQFTGYFFKSDLFGVQSRSEEHTSELQSP